MPAIYEGRCSACDAVAARTTNGYMAVYVDEPASADAHPDDPHLVILAHPCESLIMQDTGHTYVSATLGGRMVSVAVVFCRSCGRRFEVRRLTAGLGAFGCGGCLVVIAGAIAVGIWVAQLAGGWYGLAAGCLALALLTTATDSAVDRLVRWWHANRVVRLATPCLCPSCGSREYSGPGELSGAIPCTACGRHAVRFRMVAVS